jgi:hypothetical protein
VHVEQAAGAEERGERRRMKKRVEGLMNIRTYLIHLMFLSFLTWRCYVPRGSNVVEEHKNSPYVPWPGRSGR